MFNRSELEGLNRDQLAQLAEDHGITVKARTGKGELIGMLTGEQQAEDAPVTDQPSDQSDAERAAAARDQERVEIIVHSDANDSSDVKVGVNGRMYLIKRDTPVRVPKSVVNVLENAVETRLEPVGQRADGTVEYRERSARRFAFDVRG